MPASPAPSPSSPAGINEQIRDLAARVEGTWTPQALAELDVLYRAWWEARGADGGGERAA